MSTGQKHLIKCRCVLSQFKRMAQPPAHQFVVFSILGDDDKVQTKFAQCNNCGIIHKVIDVCRSEVMPSRDTMLSLVTIDDVRPSIPEGLRTVLDTNHADLATWEAVQFFLLNKLWGQFVVISSDAEDGLRQGKYVRIIGENLFNVETFTRNEVVDG